MDSPPPEGSPRMSGLRARGTRRAKPYRGVTRLSTGGARLRQLPERPYLDATQARRRNPGSEEDGLIQVPRADEEEPAHLLLRLAEGTVGGVHLATPDAHGGGRVNGLEAFRVDAVTALPEHRVIGAVLAHEGVELAPGHGIHYLLLTVDQAQVLH